MNRRSFLVSAAAAAGAAMSSPALAVDGGKPIRRTPLSAGYFGTQVYDDHEQNQLLEVFANRQPFRWYGPGSRPPLKVATFEKELAARMQTRFALAVTSGTAALSTALAALGIGPGDEVILPAWTWYSCYNAIVLRSTWIRRTWRTRSLPRPGPSWRFTCKAAPATWIASWRSPESMASRSWRIAPRAWERVTRASRWVRSVIWVFTACKSTRPSPRGKAARWSRATRCCSSGQLASTTWVCCGRRTSSGLGGPVSNRSQAASSA